MSRPKKAINFDEEILNLDAKIQKHQKSVTLLKAKRKAVVDCKNSASFDCLIDAIKDSGKSPEEVLSLLQN